MFRNASDFSNVSDVYHGSNLNQRIHRQPRRLLLFFAVFLPLLLGTQIYIFLQPAIYASNAAVLTVAVPDIDASNAVADPQHVSIQKQILTSQSLLEKTVEQLHNKDNVIDVSVDELKTMLSVVPVPDSNLVQLLAEGQAPARLQSIVNAWIDTYLQARALYVTENTEKATAAIKSEIVKIAATVETKHKQLDSFMQEHDISSQDSQDNQAHARLQGLNQSLNKALEDEVKTKAKLDTVRDAIASGKSVVPDSDTQTMAEMVKKAQELKAKVNEFNSQYTPEYIQLNPRLNVYTKELAQLEEKISAKIQSGGTFALQEAENNFASANLTVKKIKAQMDAHKHMIAEYTSQFSKYQAMKEELVKLEELQQQTKQRLIEIEVKQRELYPQVDVVNWATLPDTPIRPRYFIESLLALLGSLSLGLFAVWMVGYLNREEPSTPVPISLASIKVYPNDSNQYTLDSQSSIQKIYQNSVNLLSEQAARELSPAEIKRLFNAADQQTSEIMCLLLNGLSVEEITQLNIDCFDLQNKLIHIAARNAPVVMSTLTASFFVKETTHIWQAMQLTSQNIEALLICAAIDSGLSAPEQINAELLSFTYMVYLVRQGIKFSLLSKIFGTLSSAQLVDLGRFAPGESTASAENINMEYPVEL